MFSPKTKGTGWNWRALLLLLLLLLYYVAVQDQHSRRLILFLPGTKFCFKDILDVGMRIGIRIRTLDRRRMI